MRIYPGKVVATQLNSDGGVAARIACPAKAIPAAGRYLLASGPGAILPVALFLVEKASRDFLAAPPIPENWVPGTSLRLYGPLGHGFTLPENLNRLALAAFGKNISRLVPLLSQALKHNTSVAVFTMAALPQLPSAVEINPLENLPEALTWADFLAVDLPLGDMPRWQNLVGSPPGTLPCPGQVLVSTPMSCGGIADCGVCALRTQRSWKLACKQGPVFDLNKLEWF